MRGLARESLKRCSDAENFCLRQNEKSAGRKCDAIWNGAACVMQFQDPGLTAEPCRKRQPSRHKQNDRQCAAQDRGHQGIFRQTVKSEPQRDAGEELGVAAADIAQCYLCKNTAETEKAR